MSLNSSEVKKYLEAVVEDLLSMPKDEFVSLVKGEEEKMKEAILNGHDHLGLALWYSTDPKRCQEYIEKVKLESQKRDA